MQKTLYLAAFDVGYTHLLQLFYATDEKEAEQKRQDLERETGASCERLDRLPNGFRLVVSTIPGTIEVPTEL